MRAGRWLASGLLLALLTGCQTVASAVRTLGEAVGLVEEEKEPESSGGLTGFIDESGELTQQVIILVVLMLIFAPAVGQKVLQAIGGMFSALFNRITKRIRGNKGGEE